MSDLEVGQTAEFTKTVTEADVVMFAGITGDLNPAHIDQVWAESSRFGGRIAHGMLSASFISTVLAMKLPGPGARSKFSPSLRGTSGEGAGGGAPSGGGKQVVEPRSVGNTNLPQGFWGEVRA